MTTHWGGTGSDSDSSEVGYARFPVRNEVSQVPNPRWGMVPDPRLGIAGSSVGAPFVSSSL